MSLSSDLVAITDDHLQKIEKHPVMQAMLAGQVSQQAYADFLIRLYPVVSNFCPMMSAALGMCADRLPELRRYLYDHVQEERGHEQMVLNDLRAIGVSDTARIPARCPVPPAQALLSFNYHGILFDHPSCVLGMVYVLEILSSLYGGKVALALSRSMGRSLSSGFSFLDSHALLDDGHMAELRKLLQHDDCAIATHRILNSVDVNFYLFTALMAYNEVHREIATGTQSTSKMNVRGECGTDQAVGLSG